MNIKTTTQTTNCRSLRLLREEGHKATLARRLAAEANETKKPPSQAEGKSAAATPAVLEEAGFCEICNSPINFCGGCASISDATAVADAGPVATKRPEARLTEAKQARHVARPGRLLLPTAAEKEEQDQREGKNRSSDAVRGVAHGQQTKKQWVKVSELLDRPRRERYLQKIRDEFGTTAFRKRFFDAALVCSADAQAEAAADLVSDGGVSLADRRAVFVLGPSAAGKTFSTRRCLPQILSANSWSRSSGFISIDGGIMRDESLLWEEMKGLARAPTGEMMAGFSDLFGT